jgi:hypothetical protein
MNGAPLAEDPIEGIEMRAIVTVVVVILVVLAAGGLALVGVGKVRQAAARAQCSNNLKQIALALDNYATTYDGQVPQASIPNPRLPPERRLSWLVAIVPFVEATDLYSKIDKEKGWYALENRFAALQPWMVYRCPSAPHHLPDSPLIPSNYIGIAGLGDDAALLPEKHPRAGYFGHERKLNLKDIDNKGGLVVVVDTAHVTGPWTAAGDPTVRGLDPDRETNLGPGAPFGGTHNGGALAGLADGSFRFLAPATDAGVFEAMATLQGSKDVEPDGE